MNLCVYLFTILTILTCASCMSTCNSQVTCGECIGDAAEPCIWISKEPFKNERRCQPADYLKEKGSLSINEKDVHRRTQYKNVLEANFSSTVQFLPHEITIKASPGVTVNFTMRYKPAKDFPVDVYFLMDYSDTMKDHKEALQKQTFRIFDGLRDITQNVRLGIGSFIEKPAMPYADTIGPHKGKTYVFKNHLPLTADMNTFKRVVSDSTFGGNYDDAEAGLEALMQVMTCNAIDWRNKTRRIIVLATDSTYHSAGDGKMVGAFKPNDMHCHLEGDEYSKKIAVTHDYPSVSQIAKVASEGKFKIIFATLKGVKNVYEALAQSILGAKYAELTAQSNILEIIKEEYQESVDFIPLDYRVEKHDMGKLPPLDIVINQTCPQHPGSQQINCQISPSDPFVDIPASIKSTECVAPGTNYTVIISPLALKEELKIVFEVDCQCECEKNSNDRSGCSDHGVKKCGICICDVNRGGDDCSLDCKKSFSDEKCYRNTSDKDVCSGRGKCKCGRCQDCDTDFSGDYCQYDIKSCKNRCSDNGLCIFKKCECKQGWIHDDCSCTTATKNCIAPFSAKVCSGRGSCNCGKCMCDKVRSTNERYMGQFCDSCEECAKERCEDLKEYARCNYFKTKKVCDARFNETATLLVNLLNKTEFESILSAPCKTEMDDGSFLLFKFDALTLNIQKELEPPLKANIWIACGSAVGAILLIGFMTAIIWKILINMYDKREFEKFCNEAKSQGYDVSENPLYEPPTQCFVNPGFSQSNVAK